MSSADLARFTLGRPSVVCHLLREDPELAEAIPEVLRDRALDECLAPVLQLPRGRWEPPETVPDGSIGLLVLDGLLIRRTGVDGRFGSELLGGGDVIAPERPGHPSALHQSFGWRVIEATRVAVLDRNVSVRLARYPEITARLVERAVERSRNLALNLAIAHHARIDARVHMLLWLLADRWGRVGRDGVAVRLRLTHGDLADLVAARRPSVTTALTRLACRGLVTPVEGGWLLTGEVPERRPLV